METLNKKYHQLQNIHGDPSLDPILHGGQYNKPNICFVFMNPTGRNIASEKTWKGLKAPWIGTKNIWKLFNLCNLFSDTLYQEIQNKKTQDWDYNFADKVYEEIGSRGIYITNIAKCTQLDARPISNKVYKEYCKYLYKELDIIKPKKIITFGNQVSTTFINKPISVSQNRKTIHKVKIGNKEYDTLPVYYPVGQGQRNIGLAIEDIKWFLDKNR
ncbi:hypothetical protein K8R20_01160 [bacterium]|nr:hypothetical protein [bacterium]